MCAMLCLPLQRPRHEWSAGLLHSLPDPAPATSDKHNFFSGKVQAQGLLACNTPRNTSTSINIADWGSSCQALPKVAISFNCACECYSKPSADSTLLLLVLDGSSRCILCQPDMLQPTSGERRKRTWARCSRATRTSASQTRRSWARSPGTYRGSSESARLAPDPAATTRSPATIASMHSFTAPGLLSRFISYNTYPNCIRVQLLIEAHENSSYFAEVVYSN